MSQGGQNPTIGIETAIGSTFITGETQNYQIPKQNHDDPPIDDSNSLQNDNNKHNNEPIQLILNEPEEKTSTQQQDEQQISIPESETIQTENQENEQNQVNNEEEKEIVISDEVTNQDTDQSNLDNPNENQKESADDSNLKSPEETQTNDLNQSEEAENQPNPIEISNTEIHTELLMVQNIPDQKDIESAVNSYLTKDVTPIESLIPFVIQKIHSKRISALVTGDYVLAKSLDESAAKLSQSRHTLDIENIELEKMNTLTKRQSDLVDKVKQINSNYDNLITKEKAKTEERIQHVTEIHTKQNKEFKEKWQNPDYLLQFNHPSQELLEKRDLEKRMAISRLYDEAKIIQDEADNLQMEEEMKKQQIIEKKMELELVRLKENQQKDIEKILQLEERSIFEINKLRTKEIEPLDNAMKQLEIKKNQIKQIQCKKPTNGTIRSYNKYSTYGGFSNRVASSLTQGIGLLTSSPRTKRKMERFKEKKKCRSLQIKPISDDAFDRIEKMATEKLAKRSNLPPIHMKK